MEINIWEALNATKTLEAEVNLKDVDLTANYSLKGIKPFTVHISFDTYDEVVEVDIYAKVELILECAYSLEHFPQEIEVEETLCFNYKNKNATEEDGECFYEKGPNIDLDPYLYGLILSYIPMKVVKPGAKRPESGEGYSVMSEEEYEASRPKNTPFEDVLDDNE